MDINMDYIAQLCNILEHKTLNRGAFDALIKTRGGRRFLEYESKCRSEVNGEDIHRELSRVIVEDGYRDRYQFHRVKEVLVQFKRDIEYIRNNHRYMVDTALRKVYRIVPKHMAIKAKIYLYIGGIDGGFTLNRKDIFINYGQYIGRMDDLIGILSHELYHCRQILLEDRIKYMLRLGFRVKRSIYEVMGRIIEEGIACLIQYGPVLQKDDPINGLTRRNLLLRRREFNLLNNILLDIGGAGLDYEKISQLNIYIIGYHMISTIYNSEGVLILDHWTEYLEYKQIIGMYMEVCQNDGIGTGFTGEVEKSIETYIL